MSYEFNTNQTQPFRFSANTKLSALARSHSICEYDNSATTDLSLTPHAKNAATTAVDITVDTQEDYSALNDPQSSARRVDTITGNTIGNATVKNSSPRGSFSPASSRAASATPSPREQTGELLLI